MSTFRFRVEGFPFAPTLRQAACLLLSECTLYTSRRLVERRDVIVVGIQTQVGVTVRGYDIEDLVVN